MVQRKIKRCRHTDHPPGPHSIQTNQCLPSPSPSAHFSTITFSLRVLTFTITADTQYLFIYLLHQSSTTCYRNNENLKNRQSRSTGTVHTSTKAHLTSVKIRIRDPDRYQNLIICSLAHCQPSLKISCKSVWKFLRKIANKQTNKQ